MTLQIAIQMDPMESINPKSDTTLLLGLEAQARGHVLWHYTPENLSWKDGKLTARARRLALHDNPTHYYDFGEEKKLNLRDLDVVLLRQDPPFNMAYLSTTYMLESLGKKPLVVNDPASVRNNPEKWLPTEFKQFMPPTLISADAVEIETFYAKHRDIVVKPLYGHGGHDVFHVHASGGSLAMALAELAKRGREPVVAQKFLPEVKNQDRRIILIDGKIEAIFARIPAEGDIRANMRVGGTPAKAQITKRQREICDAVRPVLKAQGLILVGLDVIGDYLTEINVTSPTGLVAANRLYDTKLEAVFWDAVEKKLP